LKAALRASNLSQPNTAHESRYSSRNSTASDHFMIAWVEETPGHHACDEFWHPTGLDRHRRTRPTLHAGRRCKDSPALDTGSIPNTRTVSGWRQRLPARGRQGSSGDAGPRRRRHKALEGTGVPTVSATAVRPTATHPQDRLGCVTDQLKAIRDSSSGHRQSQPTGDGLL
jgi:hypothetical protein